MANQPINPFVLKTEKKRVALEDSDLIKYGHNHQQSKTKTD